MITLALFVMVVFSLSVAGGWGVVLFCLGLCVGSLLELSGWNKHEKG